MLRRRLMKAGDSIDGHEYVEIGGVKWATCNLGAENPEDIGLFFQWASTEGLREEDIGYGEGQNNLRYYPYEDTSTGEPTKYFKYDYIKDVDDAASVMLGGGWRLPTPDEILAFSNATNYSVQTINGKTCSVCTSITDPSKRVIFPIYGTYESVNYIIPDVTHFWSNRMSTNSNYYAQAMQITTRYGSPSLVGNLRRSNALFIRPVWSES